MEHSTIPSREFVHNVSAAKRLAADSGPVFITDRGQPAFVLLSIDDYRRLSGTGKSIVDLLVQPEAADSDYDIKPIKMGVRKLEE
ncbi:MAG: type II toxin-antitoxin system Phd/YefM family antitoxin [Nevskiaceae bacterium]|jgi:prevent-host-death family protein|nr:type II toxin-antitoxin system Phd/YefM family antitoxin [Nevskiaceae bacterium]